MKKTLSIAAVAAVAAIAQADMSHDPIVAPFDADVLVSFVSQSAGWTGELSWLNVENETFSPQFLLSNRETPGETVSLGRVEQGQSLYFQYEVIIGKANVYRQDDEVGALQFRHEWLDDYTARLFIEDIELPGGDRDYNDAVYDVTFRAVPTPGALGMGMAGVLPFVRRRRG
ncbi:MAG: hypothetical protein Kow0022_07950 [Phycisphaerales bacterium]